ncbi:YdbH domain-containing protein [Qipengyuania sp. XHP0207]|uniref:intermembrane phospholipid transport protein YdbH family protein n=1 Tax=Qipengyuania sp. XHP0207 TaxID=3038078 RepID=UPI00241E61CF|nr:YdbH domain-containing protein [Qipengyuania sp. XHP0207]MDG5747313.1 YdbH domain-containing protein [Qipengyuania sp. XHP0207]
MADADGGTGDEYATRAKAPRPRWRKKRWMVPASMVVLASTALAIAWFSRYDIAENVIADQLAEYELDATYDIERIGGRTQIVSDLVIGDPEAPDMTAERVIVSLRHRLGLPEIASVTLVRPRIYGSWRDGTLSFGALDNVLYRESDAPPGLPEFDVRIVDGRGLIESEFGPIGIKADGAGRLSDGFDGVLAATAPELQVAGCATSGATAYGDITTRAGAPSFAGPLRIGRFVCADSGVALADYTFELDANLDDELGNPDVSARVDGGATRYADYAASAMTGTVRASLPDDGRAAALRFSLVGRGVESPQALAALLSVEGQGRLSTDLERIQMEGRIEGNGLRPGEQVTAGLGSLATTGQGTLLEPLARRMATSLAAKTRGSALETDFRLRRNEGRLSLLLPSAELTSGRNERIVSLSRFSYVADGDGVPRLSGNITTGGNGLPRITGRMEQSGDGASVFRLSMERYAVDDSALRIPRLSIVQSANGAVRFAGQVEASGPLPGGSTSNLRVPVDGTWRPDGRLALWNACTPVAFDMLELANLRFERRGLTLCPPRGQPILSTGSGGLRVAAGTTDLDLEGFLGETPIRIASGPVGFAYPGVMTARSLDVALGPTDTASRFRISDLTARFGEDIAGKFADAEVLLDAVPLDIRNASGDWRYSDGRLALDGGEFRLFDRADPDRFEPLVARDASLTLVDNRIDAEALLRNPETDRVVTNVEIRHDLSTGAGYADLDIPGIQFDDALQPDELSRLALGIIANADGVVTGTGRIDWAEDGEVTSSGRFSSDDLDFAAAFGPVEGASGTIEFTDLLNLTTAPSQTLRVASINPGVEVLDGEVSFSLQDGELLAVEGGSWPFMGGRLILRDVDLNLGASEERRYIFEIVGLEAQQFVAQMELENISATGSFDGTIPIVFDAAGNGRIDTGVLISRPPGGNVSYIGELTYEDLSPIANFAFNALKSLDYTQMRVVMEGPLTGEIVTRVRFDGVSQGEGADGNFITKRLAALPLQFRLNIRAQFYQLLTSLKSLYDPAAVRDPRELGLLSDDGQRLLRRSITGEEAEPEIEPDDVIPEEQTIQEQESEEAL